MSVTKYFRKALASQMSPRIDFKDGKFIKTSPEQIKLGCIDASDATALLGDVIKDRKQADPNQSYPVLIALKTIESEIIDTVKTATSTDDLTAIFILPALLSQNGKLSPSLDKAPWFVREFLSPMVEPELSIGSDEAVDRYLREHVSEREQIDSWQKNWEYTRSMYEFVTHSDFDDDTITNLENVKTDHDCYVFNDTTVNAAHHILNLYDDLCLKEEALTLPLYRRFTAISPVPKRTLISNDLSSMKNHLGQMGGEYPLSPSQRESLNHLNRLTHGEILAVSGPPGTGKTTLLQSVVANLVTQHAIEQKEAPLIVAASTNNQAVTNIIDSFSHVTVKGFRNLDQRWVTVAQGFAAYFPSSSKEKEAKDKQYPVGRDMLMSINGSENIVASRQLMLSESSAYFSYDVFEISKCRTLLHSELKSIDHLKNQLLESFDRLMAQTGGQTADEYIEPIRNERDTIEAAKKRIEQSIQTDLHSCEVIRHRIAEWDSAYRKLPWYIRLLKFIPIFNKRIIHWTQNFKTDQEIAAFDSAITPQMIIQQYLEKIDRIEDSIYAQRKEKVKLQQQIDDCNQKIQQIENTLAQSVLIVAQLKQKYAINVCNLPQSDHSSSINTPNKNVLRDSLARCDMDALNNLIDTSVRYVEFWLAVHYYECVWLESVPLTEKQLEGTIDMNVRRRLSKLAMLSPCMVMTFYMLPNQFRVYNSNDKRNYYLYNHIDLLIVDEAGQTSPEIAAPSFALAKRAIVVGDEQQISPVWGTNRPLDITFALNCGVISDIQDFEKLEQSGLNTSESSVMKVASLSCPYHKHRPGLFLCEHRRCYDEIIDYCNALVYGNKLLPCRGKGHEDSKRPLDIEQYPIIGYYDIPTDRSHKAGSSRINREEASKIAEWLQTHYDKLCNTYESLDPKDVLAIITPFKEQANVIRIELKKTLGERAKNIAVGTVHTFQGGERRVIIFSTTYGASDNCYFIDHNKNLMNVAVSRAKDAFWVFGCFDSLQGRGTDTASGLLSEYVASHQIHSLVE